MLRRQLRPLLVCALPLFLMACSVGSPGPAASGSSVASASPVVPTDRLRAQAQAALACWSDAVAANAGPGVVFIGELTGQVGEWEEAVGDNNKGALMSGSIHWTKSQPTATPPDGEIRWPDGRSLTVSLLSADKALHDLVDEPASPCSACRALELSDPRLTTAVVETATGPATTPVWEFRVAGSAVRVTRVAVARRITVVPPPWDPNDAPDGLSIETASWNADTMQLTVSFVGAPGKGDEPCGADYTGEAVESDLAVVVIVTARHSLPEGDCRQVGAMRTAIVELAARLGNRVVLEIQEGLPVPVLPG